MRKKSFSSGLLSYRIAYKMLKRINNLENSTVSHNVWTKQVVFLVVCVVIFWFKSRTYYFENIKEPNCSECCKLTSFKISGLYQVCGAKSIRREFCVTSKLEVLFKNLGILISPIFKELFDWNLGEVLIRIWRTFGCAYQDDHWHIFFLIGYRFIWKFHAYSCRCGILSYTR